MDEEARRGLIELYRDGYRIVAEALLKITPEELDARPAEGQWSAREIIHHLADSEMAAAVRLRLLLANDRPHIQAYDQDQFARRLYYDRPHEMSLELFRCARASTVEILDRLTPAEWLREGTHSEAGPFGVHEWLKVYAEHAHRHARQLRVARAAATRENGA